MHNNEVGNGWTQKWTWVFQLIITFDQNFVKLMINFIFAFLHFIPKGFTYTYYNFYLSLKFVWWYCNYNTFYALKFGNGRSFGSAYKNVYEISRPKSPVHGKGIPPPIPSALVSNTLLTKETNSPTPCRPYCNYYTFSARTDVNLHFIMH